MDNYGYIRVAACTPEVKPGDVNFNLEGICKLVDNCLKEEVHLAVFPELCITGYSCGDLFGQQILIESAANALITLADSYRSSNIAIVVGTPLKVGHRLYNCAVFIQGGKLLGFVPKIYLPNYGEFYEKRWFASGKDLTGEIEIFNSRIRNGVKCPIGSDLLFEINGVKIGSEICEDLWVPCPPSSALCEAGAEIIVNLSATNELIGKHRYLVDLICNQSARCRCGYVYSSAGMGESSTDLAFAGNCIIAENGTLLAQSERFTLSPRIAIAEIDVEILRHDRQHFDTFSEKEITFTPRIVSCEFDTRHPSSPLLTYRHINTHPFVDSDPAKLAERCAEISSIQAWGLAIRLKAINCKTTIIGISGGLDSTLALLVTVKAFDMLGLDHKGIIGITMPGFGTTDRTKSNASELMELLGVTQLEIPIADAVKQHFKDIGHDDGIHDVTYENSQARERTQILMDVANKYNGIVIGTGDLSEQALGWCTYNGDHMSMYGVNGSIPKTLVKYLVAGYAEETDNPELRRVLEDIINTPISPELLPPTENDEIEQKTEDLVGPYELHDFFLYYVMRHGTTPKKLYYLAQHAFKGKYDKEVILHWLRTFYRRFFNQQFKRSCMPDGVKVGSVSLSPRGDWRMPSDASSALWLKELENL
ncbi:MAG: NAD(+) synthase [Bacteroides sp.]|nr:NAD(+) synthase [Bacteroides sp.]